VASVDTLVGDSSLEEKLRRSDAYHSLVMEKEAARALAQLDWKTIHGCFFTDLGTGKLREVDVVARQLWEKKSRQGDKIVRLHIVVECKSARDYHLLFSREEIDEDKFHRVHAEWIGWEGKNRSRLTTALSELGVSSEDLSALSREFERWAYPNDAMSVAEFYPEPPTAALYSSVFRETNTKNKRDLDSSVLWKAGQSVLAAVQGFREESLDYHIGWITLGVKVALQGKQRVGDDVIRWYKDHVKMIDLYHPVVVIESPLWVVEEPALKRVESCRLLRRGQRGEVDAWFDVVSRANLESYLRLITRHYSQCLRRGRARRTTR
jgi:hypothetical protein